MVQALGQLSDRLGVDEVDVWALAREHDDGNNPPHAAAVLIALAHLAAGAEPGCRCRVVTLGPASVTADGGTRRIVAGGYIDREHCPVHPVPPATGYGAGHAWNRQTERRYGPIGSQFLDLLHTLLDNPDDEVRDLARRWVQLGLGGHVTISDDWATYRGAAPADTGP